MKQLDFNSIYKNDSQQSTGLLFIRAYHKWHGLIKSQLKTILSAMPPIKYGIP